METSNPEGIRQRPGKAGAPIASATAKLHRDGDIQTDHPGGDAHHPFIQGVRIVGLALYFLIACLSIHVTQWLGMWLYLYDKDWYYSWMALTKAHFGLLMVNISQWWSPTTVRVSGDKSVKGQLTKSSNGRIDLDFPERMVMISNHELYTDWLYLWWAAYTANMHGHIFIILKESLQYIPLLGFGMKLFSFVFLTRNWANDKPRFAHRLDKLKRQRKEDKSYAPMWMLIFPEGTNLSKNGRAKSASWAAKNNIPDLRHCLLPRSTGTLFCLEELGDTIEWVYDCTLAYAGIPRGEYGQDIYSLKNIYLQGRGPKTVYMYWRRFAVKDLPKTAHEFDEWVQQTWREKDANLEYFQENGHFPEDHEAVKVPLGEGTGVETYLEDQLRPTSTFEILQIFVPVVGAFLVVNLALKLWRWSLVAVSLGSK